MSLQERWVINMDLYFNDKKVKDLDILEKQFFETFGIEPREYKSCDVGTFCPYPEKECGDTCPYYRTYKVDYPQITDRHYLELLALCQRKTYEEFKKESLQKIIIIMRNSPYHISQVQELFKGE